MSVCLSVTRLLCRPLSSNFSEMAWNFQTPFYSKELGSMDLRNPTQVFHSDCKNTRITVEAALIHAAPTIQNNTASASVDSNELVAPIICRSTKFNWDKLNHCIPRLDKGSVVRYKRYLFNDHASVTRPPRDLRTDVVGTPIAHSTRSRNRARSLQGNLFAL